MGKRNSVYLTNSDLERIEACDLSPIALIRMGLDTFEKLQADLHIQQASAGAGLGAAEKPAGAHTQRPSGPIERSGQQGEPRELRSSLPARHASLCPHPPARRAKGLCMACGNYAGNPR